MCSGVLVCSGISMNRVIWGKFSMTSLKNGESREGGRSKKKMNICLVSRRSVGEHFILITFKVAIKT